MIKDYQRQLNQLQVLLDAVVLALSYSLAWYFAIKNPIFPEGHGVLSPGFYFSVLIPLIPAYLALYWILGLYRPMRTIRMKTAIFRILQSNSIGLLLSATILFAFRKSGYFEHYSTRMLGFFYIFSIFFTSAERYFLRKILSLLRKNGFNQKHIILVGFSPVSDRFIDLCKIFRLLGELIVSILYFPETPLMKLPLLYRLQLMKSFPVLFLFVKNPECIQNLFPIIRILFIPNL